jgi:hypothetical protein
MLSSSVKEYEQLGTEVKSIKDCISNYIGYIIGTNGIAYLLFGALKFYNEVRYASSNAVASVSADLALVVEILIVLSIYYVMNYKFASHNRYVGYRQLLSQEFIHMKIREPEPISSPDLDFNFLDVKERCSDSPESIFTWEYVNAKWNNRIKPKEYPEDYYNKLDLRLQLPSDYKSYSLKLLDNEGTEIPKNVIQLFFENIIWTVFKKKKRSEKVYKKFIVTSWKYPRYIFILISILLAFCIGLLLKFSHIPGLYLYTFITAVLLVWLCFLWELLRLLIKDKTIDYYCWVFLAYRTRLLNNYNIRPVFLSTSFHRYFKSLKIVEFIQNSPAVIREIKEKLNCYVSAEHINNIIIKGGSLSGQEKEFMKLVKQKKKQLATKIC